MDLDEIYQRFDEEHRLNHSQWAQVEFLTTTHFIDGYLQPNDRILDIGAGTGAYSLHYAGQGYAVTAVEPVENNMEILMRHVRPCMDIKPVLGNALDLSGLGDDRFDLVLCMGPLYHLGSEEQRRQCMREAKRVCKPGGKIFFAYLSNDMVFVTEAFIYQKDPLRGANYDGDFNMVPGPFTFMTPAQAREMARTEGLREIRHFRADGLSELMGPAIDGLDEQQFREWMGYHLHTCEKPEWLGCSNHVVLVAEK